MAFITPDGLYQMAKQEIPFEHQDTANRFWMFKKANVIQFIRQNSNTPNTISLRLQVNSLFVVKIIGAQSPVNAMRSSWVYLHTKT